VAGQPSSQLGRSSLMIVLLLTYLHELMRVQCNVVILGQTKSLDFLDEKKNMKKSKAESAENEQQAHQQFQSVPVITVRVCV